MIDVKVTYYPHGFNPGEEIGSMEIINDLTNKDRPQLGNYKIKIDGKDYYLENWNRSNHIWELVQTAITLI